jgi:uncharacterized membrane protein
MSLKNLVTQAGINPGTVRLIAQRLNHYATPEPIYVCVFSMLPWQLQHHKTSVVRVAHAITFWIRHVDTTEYRERGSMELQ